MVDTVVIRVPDEFFSIEPSAYQCFSQPIQPILDKSMAGPRFTKSVYELDQELKNSGEYFPHVEVMKAVRNGGYDVFAHIKFSAPKILFGNNFEELTDSDLVPVCEALSEKLKLMGINVHPEFIKNAPVSIIHYGKNIPFTDYTTASQVVRDLSKCDTTIRKQYNKRDYKNNGETLYLQTTSSGLVFYDKKQELHNTKRCKKGRLEEDNECQFYLIEQFQQRRPFEVIRVEARLAKREVGQRILAKCNVEVRDYCLRYLFSSDVARAVLLDAFSPFEAEHNQLFNSDTNLTDLATGLRTSNPDLSPKDILMVIGSRALLGEMGFRDIRKVLGATSSQWCRIKNTIASITYCTRGRNNVAIVKKHLEDFLPIRLEDYGIGRPP